jgi:hypothetical protein
MRYSLSVLKTKIKDLLDEIKTEKEIIYLTKEFPEDFIASANEYQKIVVLYKQADKLVDQIIKLEKRS